MGESPSENPGSYFQQTFQTLSMALSTPIAEGRDDSVPWERIV
jgi:hypothetical protein